MNPSVLLFLASLAVLGSAALVVWWLADHRRGMGWAVAFVRARFPDVPEISASALLAWLNDPSRPTPQLVDTRPGKEFAVSHLAGARHMPPGTSAADFLATLDPVRPLVVYCAAGYRGARIVWTLQKAGRRDVVNLAGGIFAWGNAGLPVERHGQPTPHVHPVSRLFSRLLKPHPEAAVPTAKDKD